MHKINRCLPNNYFSLFTAKRSFQDANNDEYLVGDLMEVSRDANEAWESDVSSNDALRSNAYEDVSDKELLNDALVILDEERNADARDMY